MNVAIRGLLLGVGYGLAVAIISCGMMFFQTLQLRIPINTVAVAQAAALDLVLAAVLGLVAAPLLRVRFGFLWHLLVLAAVWSGSGLLVLPGRFFLPMVVAPAAGGLGLALIGVALARRSRALAGGIGIALWLVAIVAIELTPRLRAEPRPDVAAVLPPEGAPDIVLIVLDTVRAANMSAYGYERPTSPRFEAFAAEGALYLDATSPATWSLPSHASLFTGRFASSHGAHSENRKLEHTSPLLAEVLSNAGYETACFTANAWISDSLGLTHGIQFDDEAWRATGGFVNLTSAVRRVLDRLGFGLEDKGGGAVSSSFARWLADRPDDARPLFVFLNFVEAHFPYHIAPDAYLTAYTSEPRSELRELSMLLTSNQFANDPLDVAAIMGPATDMYDGGILYADHLLGRIIDTFSARGSLDRTVFVVLSDHGELTGEHGAFGHGVSLLEPVTRVPLAIRYPARIAAGTRVATPVSTVGVYATILDLAGLDAPTGLHVSSLIPAMRGGPPGGPVLAEIFSRDQTAREDQKPLVHRDRRFRSYRAGNLKLIESSRGDTYLFDLASDPHELNNLADTDAATLARLRDELGTWSLALALPPLDATVAASEPVELDPAARERLRALGYLE